MRDSVFVRRRRSSARSGGGEQGIDLAGIFVKQEKLLVVGAGGAKQVEAVGLRLGQSLLVAEDDFRGIVFNAAESDESAALECALRRGREGLRVGVNRGRGILPQDPLALRQWRPKGAAQGCIHCHPDCRVPAAEDDAYQVVWAGSVVALLHGRGDLVVGLGHHLRGGNLLQVVAKSAKRTMSAIGNL